MSTSQHHVDVEPEVRAMVDTLDETRQYAITRDLIAHEIVMQGAGTRGPIAFYDLETGREAGYAFGGDYIRLNTHDVRALRSAVRDGAAGPTTAQTIWSMNGAARDLRVIAEMIAAHSELVAAESAVEQARARRDELVRQVAAAGTTAYRIAKTLGVAESTIGRIIIGGTR